MLSPLPVSRKDFMLESTRGQPPETLPTIGEPGLKLPWVTMRHTMSPIGSISNVTRDLSARSSGSAQDSTRRLRGLLSKTLPVIQTSRCLSPPMCSHFDPFFQSETFSMPAQYWRVNSGSVIASHNFFGVVRMNV